MHLGSALQAVGSGDAPASGLRDASGSDAEVTEQLPLPTRAPVSDLDGIVVVELALDVRHEVEAVIGLLRAGAMALDAAPVARTAYVEQLSRRHYVEMGLRVAQEIEDEARRVHEAREAARRARGKAKR
jgi:hypothetical protein